MKKIAILLLMTFLSHPLNSMNPLIKLNKVLETINTRVKEIQESGIINDIGTNIDESIGKLAETINEFEQKTTNFIEQAKINIQKSNLVEQAKKIISESEPTIRNLIDKTAHDAGIIAKRTNTYKNVRRKLYCYVTAAVTATVMLTTGIVIALLKNQII